MSTSIEKHCQDSKQLYGASGGSCHCHERYDPILPNHPDSHLYNNHIQLYNNHTQLYPNHTQFCPNHTQFYPNLPTNRDRSSVVDNGYLLIDRTGVSRIERFVLQIRISSSKQQLEWLYR